MKLVGEKKFAVAALSPDKEIFVIHIAAFSLVLEIHPFHRTQLALFFAGNISIIILFKYTDFADILSLQFIAEVLKYT